MAGHAAGLVRPGAPPLSRLGVLIQVGPEAARVAASTFKVVSSRFPD